MDSLCVTIKIKVKNEVISKLLEFVSQYQTSEQSFIYICNEAFFWSSLQHGKEDVICENPKHLFFFFTVNLQTFGKWQTRKKVFLHI
jgi:hypothetical protein